MEIVIHGYYVSVDSTIWDTIQNEYSWSVQEENKTNGSGAYVYRINKRDKNGKRKRQYLHRIITGAGDGQYVDHINGNTLDNRLCNLRITTASGNQRNKIGTSRTGYKGVSFDKFTGRYQAKITINGETVMLGRRDSAIEAFELYKASALEHYGEYARFDCRGTKQ
jgi:hypothetical protein